VRKNAVKGHKGAWKSTKQYVNMSPPQNPA